MISQTRLWTKIDLERDGKQFDHLRLPFSSDDSAYGWIPIPLVCIRNGDGPTALLIAGNHGDEYEGQVALMNLLRSLRSSDVRGRIIGLPALNFPAVMAGRRNSPLDGGNLNRSFPGDPFGGPTGMIAHFVDSILLPLADIAVDLHSGGRSLEYLPCALMRPGRTAEEHGALRRALETFAAPVSYITSGKAGGGPTTLAAAAERHGVLTVTTELGGGAMLAGNGLHIAEEGLRRLLRQQEIVPDLTVSPAGPTRFMEVLGTHYYVYAPENGLFEPLANLGDTVDEGQPAGRIHFPDSPLREPVTVDFEASGFVICRRVPAKTSRGDCLFHLASEVAGSSS